jgi:hypothetical protein
MITAAQIHGYPESSGLVHGSKEGRGAVISKSDVQLRTTAKSLCAGSYAIDALGHCESLLQCYHN